MSMQNTMTIGGYQAYVRDVKGLQREGGFR